MRLAAGYILQEANTFSPLETTLDDFRADHLCLGDEVLQRFRGTNTEMAGFIDAAQAERVELLPIIGARAISSGRLTHEAYNFIKTNLLAGLQEAGQLDGILLALHGSMAVDELDDPEGDLLAAVRDLVGEDLPLVASLDMHANITRLMVSSADALVGYRTHPHTDQHDTGQRAANILFSMSKGQLRPTVAFRKVPVITYPERMPTSIEGPMTELVARAKELEKQPGVVSISVFPVQPWLDVEEMGSTMVVVTNNDPALAQGLADELGQMLWERRQQFKVPLFSLADAIERALQTEGPVILSYASDNISGGSPGDSTLALQALVERKIEGRTLLTLVDSQAVAEAIEAGVGQKVTLEVGAKIDQVYSQPVPVTGTVRLISDGQFTYKGPLYTGLKANMGRTVVLQSGCIFLVLSERAISTFDPELYRSVGLEPSEAKIVVVRENGAFRAAYTEIMTEALPLDTPGFSTSNLNLLPFRRVPRPLYPLDRDFSWTPL